MKIFALNLSLEFQWTQPQQRYYFEPISWSQLLQEMENGRTQQRQFYVRIEPGEAQLEALFALQADETWRQTHSNLVLMLPSREATQEFTQNFQRLFTPKLAAGGLVRSEEGSYCCIHNRGCWTLPKGHVDPGETIEAAAVREVQEETGLQEVRLIGKIGETLHTFQRKGQWTLKTTHWYRMAASTDQALLPQADEDIDAVAWKSKIEWLAVAQQSYPLIREIFEAEFARNL